MILLAAAGASFSIAAYAVASLDSGVHEPITLAIFIVLPLTFGVALAAVSFFAQFRKVVAIHLVAMGFALIAAETYMLSVSPTLEDYRREAADAWGVVDDGRDRLQVILDHERDGKEAFPPIVSWQLMIGGPNGTTRSSIEIHGKEVLPLAGISRVLTVACNEYGFWLTFTSDEHGFNNPPELWDSNGVDLVLLGDSFTFGNCVPSEQHFAGIIRKKHPKTLNLGYVNWGPVATYATLVEYGPAVAPKHVFWFFFEGNDMTNMTTERTSPLLMRYVEGQFNQGLLNRQSELDTVLKERVAQLRHREVTEPAGGQEFIGKLAQVILLRNVRKAVGVKAFKKENRPVEWKLYPELLE